MGKWEPYSKIGRFLRIAPIHHDLNSEDNGSLQTITLQNRTCEECILTPGEPIAILIFKKGQYSRTSAYVDLPLDRPSVCALDKDAIHPVMIYGFETERGFKTQWRMFATGHAIIPSHERKEMHLGVSFDIPENMIGTWIPNPYRKELNPDMGNNEYVVFKATNYQDALTGTQHISVHNEGKETAFVSKGDTIAILQFTPRQPELLPEQATVSSVLPGSKTTRQSRNKPWEVYPSEACSIPPDGDLVVKIGVTYHVPPNKIGRWIIHPNYQDILTPRDRIYIKDPELTVHNLTDRQIDLTPDVPIATMRLFQKTPLTEPFILDTL